MKLNKILKNIKYKGNPDSREIINITHDSRKVKDGTLFIAISGENNDGHDFIFDAIKKGAVAIIANGRAPATNLVPIIQVDNPRKTMSKIADNFFEQPSSKLNIIGITGTNGKTTTTQIIDHILKTNNFTSSSLGTLGFNSPSGIISTGFTTPESIDLHQILKMIKDGGIEYVPMEISSHAIEMNRIDDVKVDIGIFTNIGLDHLDFHKTQENYFNSKLKLFKNLSKNNLAILNNDDKYCNRIIENINCKHLTYGFSENSDLRIKNYTLNINYSKAKVKYQNKVYDFKTNLIGKYNLSNLMAAMLCCIQVGISLNHIIRSIKNINNVSGRLEKFTLDNNNIAIIDYAHTPDAYENIFKTVHEIDSKRKVVTIFGCGGNRDKSKRPLMANIAEKYSNEIYLTEDNSRHENRENIFNDIMAGFKENKHKIIIDRKKAIIEVLQKSKNSIILILGKGVENYQDIKGEKYPHSDIKIVKEFINENRN